jgi:hypothetical protein
MVRHIGLEAVSKPFAERGTVPFFLEDSEKLGQSPTVLKLLLVILALSFAAASGCHVGCCSKRASEKKCPTDIRKMHCWCFGEDALFRYPCGPNSIYYGHKATCWREWPSSGSEWRDAHCGPPIVPALMPHEAEVMPVPPMTAPAPADGETPNPFRDEPGQGSPAADMQAPSSIGSGAAEPNPLRAVPESDGTDVPVVPPQELPPEQLMPQAPMSGDGFQPMYGETQPRFQSWPAHADGDRAPVQSQSPAAEYKTVPVAAVGPARVVEDLPPRRAAALSTPISETESRWRLVIHDDPDGIPASSSDHAPLFRPPSLDGNQTPRPQAQRPAPRRRSLEEQTGDALQRFMSVR